MRKLNVGLFISLDGVVEGPGPQDGFERAGWTMPYWSDEIGAFIFGSMATSDTLLLGRVTYEGFQAAFGNPPSGHAVAMNGQRKYVVSNTLKSATWQNSQLISGSNVIEQIRQLKQGEGKDITVSGSIMLVQALLENDLVDELGLILYPI